MRLPPPTPRKPPCSVHATSEGSKNPTQWSPLPLARCGRSGCSGRSGHSGRRGLVREHASPVGDDHLPERRARAEEHLTISGDCALMGECARLRHECGGTRTDVRCVLRVAQLAAPLGRADRVEQPLRRRLVEPFGPTEADKLARFGARRGARALRGRGGARLDDGGASAHAVHRMHRR